MRPVGAATNGVATQERKPRMAARRSGSVVADLSVARERTFTTEAEFGDMLARIGMENARTNKTIAPGTVFLVMGRCHNCRQFKDRVVRRKVLRIFINS